MNIISFSTSKRTDKKRLSYWRIYGKRRSYVNKLEFIQDFDERVYKLGLKALAERNCNEWIDAEKERPKAGQVILFIDAVGTFRGVYHVTRSGVVHVEGNKKDCIEWENIYQWVPYPKEK